MKKLLVVLLLLPSLAFAQAIPLGAVPGFSNTVPASSSGSAASITNAVTTCVSGAVGRLLYTAAGLAVKCDATSPQWDPVTGTFTVPQIIGSEVAFGNLALPGQIQYVIGDPHVDVPGNNVILNNSVTDLSGMTESGLAGSLKQWSLLRDVTDQPTSFYTGIAADVSVQAGSGNVGNVEAFGAYSEFLSGSGKTIEELDSGVFALGLYGDPASLVKKAYGVRAFVASGASSPATDVALFYGMATDGGGITGSLIGLLIGDISGATTSRAIKTGTGIVELGDSLIFSADGAGDIGASGANRPNNLFLKGVATLGTSAVAANNAAGNLLMASTDHPVKTFTATYDPGTLAAQTGRTDTITVTGVKLAGGAVSASPGVDAATGCVLGSVRASADDTVKITWFNAITAVTACDTASSTWTFTQQVN